MMKKWTLKLKITLMRIKAVILLCLIFLTCKKEKHVLPNLSYYINNDGKKVNYTISDFHFTNHLNQPFTDVNIENKIVIANFFFTRCPSICPKMKASLHGIAKEFEKDEQLLITSFTIDLKHDTIPVLSAYANSIGVDNSKWLFLHGNEAQLKHIIQLFKTSFRIEDEGIDFYHSPYAAIVDTNQEIRGFYNLTQEVSTLNLKRDIRTLLK